MPPQDTPAELQALGKTISRLINVYFILAVAVTVYVFELKPEETDTPFRDLELPWFKMVIPGELVSTLVPLLLASLLFLIAVFSRAYRGLYGSAAGNNGGYFPRIRLQHDMATGYSSVDRLVDYLWRGRNAHLIIYRLFYFILFVVVKTVFYAGPLLVSTYVFYTILHHYAEVPPASDVFYSAIFKTGYLLTVFALFIYYFDYGAGVFGEISNYARKIVTHLVRNILKRSQGAVFDFLCGLFEGVLVVFVLGVIVCGWSYLVAVGIISFLPSYKDPWEFAAVCLIPAVFGAALFTFWVFIFRDYFLRRARVTD
jgi:hypothetical protein